MVRNVRVMPKPSTSLPVPVSITARRIVRLVACLPAIAAAPSGLGAQAANPCSAARTQLELNLCAAAAAARADSTLERTYTAQLARVDSARRPAFAEAQAAWQRYRTAYCRYRASAYEGGSMQPMVFGLCLADEAMARERQLRRDARRDAS